MSGPGGNNIRTTEVITNVIKLGVVAVSTFYFIKWAIKELDPTKKQRNQQIEDARSKLKSLNIKLKEKLTDHEMSIASHLVDPDQISVTWDSIAGLDNTIQDLKQTVIFPVKHRELFTQSKLTKPPKGILLYGAPGCGKTMVAKATAKEAGMNFVNLDISLLTDKWYGESQKLAAAVFSVARKIQPCIIFIDEIDSFLRARSSSDHEATAMMKAQFMSLWDGIATDNECVTIVMGATNRPTDLDPAILRRMPKRFAISLPNVEQRKALLELFLSKEKTSKNINYRTLAEKTDSFSGSDLAELCRTASFRRIDSDFIKKCNESVNSSSDSDIVLPEITMSHLESTIQDMRSSSIMHARQNSAQERANESDA